jgi:hypothetical protein
MTNRLGKATSPYLLQHRDNPVDWYEWGDEAFAAARERDVPILLSVGYAACHWCHVMAHESFEDPATAEVMNRWFVSVKVDREERPDVDRIYMDATQMMTGSGGWPMTVFLTPAGEPFYAGTYFPPTDRHGHPSFTRVLEAVHDAWDNRRGEIEGQATRLREAVAAPLLPAEDPPDAAPWLRRTTPSSDRSMPRSVDSACSPSSRRRRPWSSSSDRRAGRGHRDRRRCSSHPSPPCTGAGSTTGSGEASPGTRSTAGGWCPISRRCCTTTLSSPASTPAPIR